MKIRLVHIIICLLFISTSYAENAFDQGIEAFGKEEYSVAIKCFNEAVDSSPTDISAYYNLGLSYMGHGDYSNALWAFEKVLKMDPSDAAAAERASMAYMELDNQNEWEPILNGPFDFVFNVTSNTWSIISVIISLIFAGSVVVFRKTILLSSKRFALIISLTSLLLLLVSIHSAHRTQAYYSDTGYAIVTLNTIPTFINEKTANGSLNAGTRVHKVSIHSEQLINVEDSNGNHFLVRSEDLSFI
jgi:tetratricopeptide (TPR) repeat protein